MKNASQVYAALLRIEVDGAYASDLRRAISDERQALHLAIASKDASRINACRDEAMRVMGLWGVL